MCLGWAPRSPPAWSVQLTSGRVAYSRSLYRATAYGGPRAAPRGHRTAAAASVGPVGPRASVPCREPGVSGTRPSSSSLPNLPKAPVQPGGRTRRSSPGSGKATGGSAVVSFCHSMGLSAYGVFPAGKPWVRRAASEPDPTLGARPKALLRTPCESGSCGPSTRASSAGIVRPREVKNVRKFERQNARLREELGKARMIIDVQGVVGRLPGV